MSRFWLPLLVAHLAMGAPSFASAATAPQSGIEGRWAVERVDPGAPATATTLTFTRSGDVVAGTLGSGADQLPLFDVRDTGGRTSFTLVIPGMPYVTVHYAGTRTDMALKLASSDEGNGVYTLSATRIGAPPPRAATRPTPSPVAAARPPAAARPATPPALRQTVPPATAEAIDPGVPDYISRLLGPSATGAAPQPAPAAAPSPQPVTRTASLPPAPQLRPSTEAPPTNRRPALPPPPPPQLAASLEGTWRAERTAPDAKAPVSTTLLFKRTDGALAGVMRDGTQTLPLFELRQAGVSVSFMLIIPGTPYVAIRYIGTVMGDELMVASLDEGQGVYTLSAHREGDAAPIAVLPRVSVVAPPVSESQRRLESLIPPPPTAQAARVAATPPAAETPAPEDRAPPSLPLAPPEPTLPPLAPSSLTPAAEPMPQIASLAPPRSPGPGEPIAKLPLPELQDVTLHSPLKTPPMGWASRQRLGTMIDDESIKEAADALDETGLKALGYTYIEVDDGWQGARDAHGMLHGGEKFPDMKALGDYIHSKGLIFGLMTSVAPQSCAGFTGSYGHEREDAKTFAEWGVDVLIYDWCGAEKIYPTQAEIQATYQKMGEALKASGRDIAYSISEGGEFDVASWAAKTGATIWRTGKDVQDNWQSVMEASDAVNGIEPNEPGRWSDPGLVQIGNGGMTPDEYRSHLNLWAVMGGPLVLGTDIRIMRKETMDLLTNKEVLAVDQDAAVTQGRRVVQSGSTEVWAKPLADGSTAVLFVNRGTASASVAVSWEQLGIVGRRQVRDLWWHESIGTANNRYAVFLTAHTSLLVRMTP